MQNKWDIRFLDLAKYISQWSKDDSTKVGAVITKGNRIVSLGYNGFPAGIADHWESREEKILKTIHAEENAIMHGKNVEGCTLYVYPLHPCARCAARIIQAGIKRVVVSIGVNPETLARWIDEAEMGAKMFKEAGVEMEVRWDTI